MISRFPETRFNVQRWLNVQKDDCPKGKFPGSEQGILFFDGRIVADGVWTSPVIRGPAGQRRRRAFGTDPETSAAVVARRLDRSRPANGCRRSRGRWAWTPVVRYRRRRRRRNLGSARGTAAGTRRRAVVGVPTRDPQQPGPPSHGSSVHNHARLHEPHVPSVARASRTSTVRDPLRCARALSAGFTRAPPTTRRRATDGNNR